MRTDEVDLVVQIHVDHETILTRLETATSPNQTRISNTSRYWINSQLKKVK